MIKQGPGTLAIDAGKAALEHVKEIFDHHGYYKITGKNRILTIEELRDGMSPKNAMSYVGGPAIITKVKAYEGIYGSPFTLSLVAYDNNKHPDGLAVNIKWQSVGGSVDEKLPYMVACMKKLPMPAIAIIDGGGFRKEAEEWLIDQQDNQFTVYSSIGAFFRDARTFL